MDINIEDGQWVVAVSGGVDSIVLLDLLYHKSVKRNKETGKNKIKLIVAHFDHGIRQESKKDRIFVQRLADDLGLKFVYDVGNLGSNASESFARETRYEFLHKVRTATNSTCIITAHHQDDILETAIHNLIRGTGRRGMTSLKSTKKIYRPLAKYSKQQIYNYAVMNKLTWNEDITNQDVVYTRNYIRHKLLPYFSDVQKQQLTTLIDDLRQINDEIDTAFDELLRRQQTPTTLNRLELINLPYSVSSEFIHAWLRLNKVTSINRKIINRLVVAAKTGKKGRIESIDLKHNMVIESDLIKLVLN